MLNSCPTQEAVEYLRVEWMKYEMKCRDIEVGTTILMELDPSLVKRIVAGIDEQTKEYSKLSSNMGRILTNLTQIQHDNQQHLISGAIGDGQRFFNLHVVTSVIGVQEFSIGFCW